MKESNNAPLVNCDNIEQLLIKQSIDELTDEENRLIQKHLKSCQRCRSYQSALLKLKYSMQVSEEDKLAPNPAIHEILIQRMKELRPQEIGFLDRAYQSIISLFEYRIPVYQALTGVILIFLLFLGLRHFPFTTGQKSAGIQSITPIGTSTPAQLMVIDNLDIIGKQKIGQNVKEDSTLIRFIVTM